jgi:hypothetical protein
MDALGRGLPQQRLLNALAGLELGVLGGVLMLVWYALISPVFAQPWWTVLNLLASKYFALRVVRSDAGLATVTGAAMHIVMAGIVGALAGILTPATRLWALGVALLWYLAAYFLLWKHAAPLLVDYSPQPILAFGYFLYGSVLGYRRSRVRALGGL